jgi:hypothetical protein
MFTLFTHNKELKLPPIPQLEQIKVPHMENENTTAGFMVGITTDGRTQLRVGNETSMTLTMNPDTVRALIVLLEATLPLHETE